jgi:hypothetical protein
MLWLHLTIYVSLLFFISMSLHLPLNHLPLSYVTLHYASFCVCHELTSLVGDSELIQNSYLFLSILFLMLLSLSLSIPLSQFLYPTPHHRSCYRPFHVFYREFTRSVPREHRQEHKVREDQGANLLSRDLLRTPLRPRNVHKRIFQETSYAMMDSRAYFLQELLHVAFAFGTQLNLRLSAKATSNRGRLLTTQRIYL